MAIFHVHTSPPLLCLLEGHVCLLLTSPEVLSYWGRWGRSKGAGVAPMALGLPRDEIRPILSHTCLYWAVSSLKAGPHLFFYFEHHHSSETEARGPQTSVTSLCSYCSLTLGNIKLFLQGPDQMPLSPWQSLS